MVLVQESHCSLQPTSVRRLCGRPSAPRQLTLEEVREHKVLSYPKNFALDAAFPWDLSKTSAKSLSDERLFRKSKDRQSEICSHFCLIDVNAIAVIKVHPVASLHSLELCLILVTCCVPRHRV